MCFCPQIEPVEVASVLEKSFKNFHDKHGIGEAELKWPSRVRKQGEKARVGEDNLWGPSLIPRGLATLRRGSSGGALQKFVQQHDCHLEDKLTGEKTEAVFQDV